MVWLKTLAGSDSILCSSNGVLTGMDEGSFSSSCAASMEVLAVVEASLAGLEYRLSEENVLVVAGLRRED